MRGKQENASLGVYILRQWQIVHVQHAGHGKWLIRGTPAARQYETRCVKNYKVVENDIVVAALQSWHIHRTAAGKYQAFAVIRYMDNWLGKYCR